MHVFWRNPEHPVETHTGTWRPCKLHTDRPVYALACPLTYFHGMWLLTFTDLFINSFSFHFSGWQQNEKVSPDITILDHTFQLLLGGFPDIRKPTVRFNLYGRSLVCPGVSNQWNMSDTALAGVNRGHHWKKPEAWSNQLSVSSNSFFDSVKCLWMPSFLPNFNCVTNPPSARSVITIMACMFISPYTFLFFTKWVFLNPVSMLAMSLVCSSSVSTALC